MLYFCNCYKTETSPSLDGDFSYLTETGRLQTELLNWSYGSEVIKLLGISDSLLDMGTGGGEFLDQVRPLPSLTMATEGYEPNLPAARDCLEPKGVSVVEVQEDDQLPIEDERFNLIINRHESYDPKEVDRVLRPGGYFLTQQVGGSNDQELNEALSAPLNDDYRHWNLEYAVNELQTSGFIF